MAEYANFLMPLLHFMNMRKLKLVSADRKTDYLYMYHIVYQQRNISYNITIY